MNNILTQNNPINSCIILTNVITSCASECFGEKVAKFNVKNSSNKFNWFNNECAEAREKLLKVQAVYNRDIHNFPNRQAYFNLKKKYNKLLKNCKNKFCSEILESLEQMKNDSTNCNKKFWTKLRSNSQSQQTSTEISPQKWFHYFKSLSHESSNNSENLEVFIDINEYCELNHDIDINEIIHAVKNSKNKKSCGFDGIKNEYIKSAIDTLAPILLKIFNDIMHTGLYPWKKSIICPIFKKGDNCDPRNYRGISLTSSLSKLFNTILNNRLVEYLKIYNILPKEQGGFQIGKQTSDNIFILKTILKKYKLNKKEAAKKLFLSFVDFQKAFDTVNRNKLISKLHHIGIRGKFLNIIKDMYNNTQSCVKTPLGYTNFFETNLGVLQGDVLSPTLFIIYLHDFPQIFDSTDFKPVNIFTELVSCLLWADDLILLSETIEGLQLCLKSLEQYCIDWSLTVNIDKTKAIYLNTDSTQPVFFKHEEVEQVSSYSYLGVIIHKSGQFHEAKKDLLCKARKGLFKLRSLFFQNKLHLKPLLALHCYEALIKPIYLYACEVWVTLTKTFYKEIEQFDINFLRHILGVRGQVSPHAVRIELGKCSPSIDINSCLINYRHRLNNTTYSTNPLLFSAYMTDKLLSATDKTTFYNVTNNIIAQYNLNELLDSNLALATKKKKIKEVFIDNNIQDQNFHILHNNKLSSYRSVAPNGKQVAGYITAIKNTHQRISVTKLRLSAHKLNIETGRYTNTPRENRICTFCNDNAVEDETHFLRDCTLYNKIRESFMQKHNLNLNDLSMRLTNTHENPDLIEGTAEFIFKIEKMRLFKDKNPWSWDVYTPVYLR